MATTTTNYGFDVPTSSDLVKNGATAISTLGQDIDTFLFRPFGVNPVLNSAMQVWQRGTSVSVPSSASTYTADRWALYRGATGMTVSRQTTSDTTNLPFIQYCARIQRNAGDTSTVVPYFSQSFETINSIPYAGKTVTLSFYVRKGANFSSATGISVNVVTGTGTDQSWLGYTGTVFALNQDNQAITTTWQRLTYTFSIGATATELTPIFSYNPSGTAGANDYFEITGVQLEVGSVATPFKTNGGTIQGELAACMRYFYRMIDGTGTAVPAMIFCDTTSRGIMSLGFPTVFRVGPSVTATASNFRLNVGSTGFTVSSALNAYDSDPRSITLVWDVATSPFTAGQAGRVNAIATGSPTLDFSAEL